MSTAFLVSLMILVPALTVLSYFAGYRAGLEDQTPPDKLPCGHKRNPHQWGEWTIHGNLAKRPLGWPSDAPDIKLPAVGIIQQRICERCKYTELDYEQQIYKKL